MRFKWWLLKFRLRRRWFNWRVNRCLRLEGMPTIQELAKLGEDKEAEDEP